MKTFLAELKRLAVAAKKQFSKLLRLPAEVDQSNNPIVRFILWIQLPVAVLMALGVLGLILLWPLFLSFLWPRFQLVAAKTAGRPVLLLVIFVASCMLFYLRQSSRR